MNPLMLLAGRHAWLLTLCLMAVASWPGQVGAVPVEIALRSHARVTPGVIHLGDIALVSGADEDSLTMLRSLSLGNMSRSTVLERRRIEQWLRLYTRQFDVKWSGAHQVQLELAQQTLAADRVAAEARLALDVWLQARVKRTQIAVVGPQRDIVIPSGAVRLEVRPIASGVALARRMPVWVDIVVEDIYVRSVVVNFEVQAYRTAYLARRDLALGSVVNASEFEQREVDIAEAGKEDALPVNNDTTAWRMKQSVQQGRTLVEGQVGPIPDVVRGQSAILRSQNGMVTLESKVEVLQDGFTGQSIKVRPAAGSGALTARVAGVGVLEMTER
ncbi:flagella basal body P-ring formation protein FlgA [Herbaspirillum autotrophicum]|uniref:flagella basal body P-ring formation protein FlgA n=1 Tax=Herbaspirillum autotrophicum TaxID=180195 RepID=UPI00067E5CE7|nr:flagella basal body P-ring formation protein FlgA [Herbaspirillum autotrophicum]